MEQKQQLVSLALSGHFTMSELCVKFGVSRKTGHKWRRRYGEGGSKNLEERSRAPKKVTSRTPEAIERLIVGERQGAVDANKYDSGESVDCGASRDVV